MAEKNSLFEVFEKVIGEYFVNSRIRILYVITNCQKTGPTQQLLNIIRNLDKEAFEARVITVYDELQEAESLLSEFKKELPVTCIPTSKARMMTGAVSEIKDYIKEYSPNVIHSSGVFPDYMISRLKTGKQVLTSRNFVYDDYVSKYGKIRGNIMAKMHLHAMMHTRYARACSESLNDIYKEKLGIELSVIRNGVDIDKYYPCDLSNKEQLRKELELPQNATIIVYGAGFNERKNHEFLLRSYVESKCFTSTVLLLLGRGQFFDKYKGMYSKYSNILMLGSTTQMNEYLRASDYYVSTSKSEGLPNGVIEALASGLPVVLSDIPQHGEILSVDSGIGYLYRSGDARDFSNKLDKLLAGNKNEMSTRSRIAAEEYFDARNMSQNYQDMYKLIAQDNQNWDCYGD